MGVTTMTSRPCPPAGRLPVSSPPRPSWPSLPLPLACLADRQRPSSEQCPVERGNRRLGLGGVGHLDKAKAPRPARLSISEDLNAVDNTVRVKELRQVFFRGRPVHISHKNSHDALPFCWSVGVRRCLSI